jgi:hypothetical protein
MSSEIEAAGAAVTAGLAAAAIEKHGKAAEAHGPCANCGAELNGAFCATCGQPAHIHRTLGHLIEEIIHGVLHFDARAWRTLPLLAFRPGTLTRNYIHGQRARYISPLALFLFVVFTMFFVFSVIGETATGADETPSQFEESMLEVSRLERALAEGRETLGAQQQAVAAATDDVARAAAQAEVSSSIAGLLVIEADLAAARAEFEQAEDELSDQVEGQVSGAPGPDEDGVVRSGGGMQQILDEIGEAARNGEVNVNMGSEELNKKVLKNLQNPELALYKVQNTAYKFSFLLVPISLPFMWLMFFWKRGVTLFDHAVFILYSLCFVSLLLVVLVLFTLTPIEMGLVSSVVCLAIPVHFFFQLKGGYSLGWFSALWRTFFLLIFCILTLSLFVLAIIALGLM